MSTESLRRIAARHKLRGRGVIPALREAFAAGSEARASYSQPGRGRPRFGDLPGEDAVLRELLAMHAMRSDAAKIADWLNRRGMTRRAGKPWTARAVRDVLRAAE